MANTTFQDFSHTIKVALNDVSLAWLYETAGEVAAKSTRNCKMRLDPYDKEEGKELAESYRYRVNDEEGVARIGSPRESAYWEEFGTGEYADKSKNGGKEGRRGWWIFIPGQASQGGGNEYRTKEEAESMAAYIRKKYNKPAIVTNGREPNYTLEKAYKQTVPNAEEQLKELLKERFGE